MLLKSYIRHKVVDNGHDYIDQVEFDDLILTLKRLI